MDKNHQEAMRAVGTKNASVFFVKVSDEIHCNIKNETLKRSEALKAYNSVDVAIKEEVCSFCFYKCFN